MENMPNPNVLSERYATPEINSIFSEEGKIIVERELWIAVMKAQRELGLNIPAEEIEKYEKAKNNVDLKLIKEIESTTKHDVKAGIDAFVKAAGAEEHIHKGMTSRDLTDNVEQMQIRNASRIIFGRYISILRHMNERAEEYKDIVLTARTHHQAAQPTLLGRRMAMWVEELLLHLPDFEKFIEDYPLRGIKGAVGTQFDMLTLLKSQKNVEILEEKVAEMLGFKKTLSAPGQVYPRSLDSKLLSNLALLSSACENYAIGMRLMAGYDLLTEGFAEGQVGSSAMPHKMNTRSSERIWGLSELLKMYADGGSRLAGSQWEEGDVSCSVIRRIIIPDAIYTSDGLCETTLTVLNQMGAYPVVIDAELNKYLPFLATTEMLMMAIESGIGRETAHKLIKKYSVGEALKMRQQGKAPELSQCLAQDPVCHERGITKERIDKIFEDKQHFIGNAGRQISSVSEQAGLLINKYKQEASYEPRSIL